MSINFYRWRLVLKGAILGILLLGAQFALAAQKTFNISTQFTTIAGTPRATFNDSQNRWLVVWRHQKATPVIHGRTVDTNGLLGGTKILARSISGSEHSLDVEYNPVNRTYLLAFENRQGLHVQSLNESLARRGSPIFIESASGTVPRLLFNTSTQNFLLVFAGSNGSQNRKRIKSVTLNGNGNIVGSIKILKNAAAGKFFEALEIARNSATGNSLVLFTESNLSSGAVKAVYVKPDGSRLSTRVYSIQTNTPNLDSVGGVDFGSGQNGFVFWSDKTALKRRKFLNVSIGATQTVPNSAGANSDQTSIVYDSANDQFVGVWTFGNAVRALSLNSANGSVVESPFQVGTTSPTLRQARHASTSYDPATGKIIAVWEESDTPSSAPSSASAAARFRVRATIFNIEAGGPAGPIIEVDPSSLSIFADQPGSPVTITNRGDQDLTLTSIQIVDPNAEECLAIEQTNDCPASLASSEQCVVTVSCTIPCPIISDNKANLEISSNDRNVTVEVTCQ